MMLPTARWARSHAAREILARPRHIHQPRLLSAHATPKSANTDSRSLAELIAFESTSAPPPSSSQTAAEALVERAARVLEAAKEVLGPEHETPSSLRAAQPASQAGPTQGPITAPSPTPVGHSGGLSPVKPPSSGIQRSGGASSGSQGSFDDEDDATRRVLQNVLKAGSSAWQTTTNGQPLGGRAGAGQDAGAGAGSGGSGAQRGGDGPAWANALFGNRPTELQAQRASPMPWTQQLDFAEPSFGTFEFLSQEAVDAERELPPLQSLLDLTSAATPPQRDGEASPAQSMGVGRQLEDGKGTLPDGTRWEKQSGEEFGENGLWKKWTVLRGGTPDGKVQWEEAWWEVTDWTGMRELGARKSGNKPDGSAWREEWNERISHDAGSLKMVIERDAHKWARDAANDEWEEKWGEYYVDGGAVRKYADKWAKAGNNVWHEKWGEDYPGDESCVKYTDKWAERLLEGGGTEQWGDKWTESFGAGKGTKHGEVWSAESNGNRYNRWWNEEHYGDGRVRKYGNSTGGEYWDTVEHMDTYYNPIPHFGGDDGEGDGFGGGMDNLDGI